MKLLAFRKRGRATVAHLVHPGSGHTLCGINVGVEGDWNPATFFEHSSCQRCASARRRMTA